MRVAIARLLLSVGLPCESFANAADFLKRAEGGVSGCLVLDVRMPGMGGLDLQRVLSATGQEIPIIFVTAYADVRLTVRAMKDGALEVLTKPFDDQVLLDSVNTALKVAEQRRTAQERRRLLEGRFESLPPREREVMSFVVSGLPNKQIAGALGTTEKTIKAHRAQVMHKMEADSLPALVRMADTLHLAARET